MFRLPLRGFSKAILFFMMFFACCVPQLWRLPFLCLSKEKGGKEKTPLSSFITQLKALL